MHSYVRTHFHFTYFAYIACCQKLFMFHVTPASFVYYNNCLAPISFVLHFLPCIPNFVYQYQIFTYRLPHIHTMIYLHLASEIASQRLLLAEKDGNFEKLKIRFEKSDSSLRLVRKKKREKSFYFSIR